jgi:hypothetical protein
MALYEDYISDDPSLPHCNNGVFESPKHPVFGLQTAKCGCYDSETKTNGELVRIKDQTPIRRGVFIYKVQCISRPLRRLTEHRLLDELLRRRMEALEVVSRRSLGSKNCGALCQRWKRQNEIRKMCKTTKCAGLGKQCVMQCTRYVLRKRAKRRKHKELKKTNYMCMKKCYGMTHSKCYQNCKNPPQRPNLTTAYKQYRNPYRIYDWRDRYQPPLINENRRPQNVYAEPTQNGGPDVYTGPKISEVEETVDGANMYTGPPIS